jgi:hypothetical protein
MTQADSALALGMSLDSRPSVSGQGQAEITATTPLPDGWGSFCSRASKGDSTPGRWYATAPWDVDFIVGHVSEMDRDLALKLEQTVDAPTWPALHAEVARQVAIHQALSAGKSL